MTPDHITLPLTATTAAATADGGPGGGWIPDYAESVTVTSSASTKFIVLADTFPQGHRVWINVGANGCKLKTAKSGETINNVDTSASAVAALPANSSCLLWKTLAGGWVLSYFTNLGAVGTAIVPA